MADDQNPELPLTPPPPGEGGSPGALNIQPVNIEDEMRRSYLDYSMSVIIGRALPDVRDGLKPVHRRILYAMHEMGLAPNRATRKCARIVGDVHGQIPSRTATSPSTTPWCAWRSPSSMRYPLVDRPGKLRLGRWRSAGGHRYTEAKLAADRRRRCSRTSTRKPSTSVPTTTTATVEPEVLPARIPESAGQRFRRHRRRHGHQHPAAQPHRDRRRHHHAGEQSARHARPTF